MAWDATDWKITRSSKQIEYIGDLHAGTAPTYVTGVELHRALMDMADAASDVGDDQIAIIDLVPSQRLGADTNITLLNGYTLTSATAEDPQEHIYDTSITYGGGTDIYDGIQVFGNSTNIQVIQNGVRTINDFWNQPKMITAVEDAASSTSHRFLIKTRTAGVDIDGRRIIGTQRELGTVYTEFSIGGGTNRGNNVLALTANGDLNNAKSDAALALMDSIANATEGYNLLNVDTLGDDPYYSNWTLGTQSKNDFYERAKWIQTRVAGIGVNTPARDADQSLYGLAGDIFRGITHELAVSGGAGAFVSPEEVSWTGGTGQLLAIDSLGSPTTAWLQILTGVAPTGTLISAGAGTASAWTIGTVTAKLISLPFIGASTGSAIIGAFGLGVLPDDLGQNDSATDLTGGVNVPLNNVPFNVTGLDITAGQEDYVLVGPESGGALAIAFDTIATSLTTSTETAVVVTTAIPTDVPAAGSIRIENDEGRYVKITYESYTGSTYTIDTTDWPTGYDFSGTGDNDAVTAGQNYFPTWLDQQAVTATESVTVVYLAPRDVVVRVRNGYTGTPAVNPIVPFETVAILGSTGGSQAASRVLDL